MLQKKRYIIFFLVLFFFAFPSVVFADPSCCVNHGGEYACNASTSQLYCADGTISTDCTCRVVATPTPTPSPTVTPTLTPVVSPPTCPDLASYDPTLQTCKCHPGYIANGTMCVSYAEFCWTKYGGNAKYDTNTNACSCSAGYTWNNDQTSCISMNELCHSKLDNESYYNSDNNTCNCFQGYSVQNNSCQPIPTQVVQPQSTSVTIPTLTQPETTYTPTPSPTIAVVKKPSPTPMKSVLGNSSSKLVLKGNRDNYYVSMTKPHPSALAQFFESIWQFIQHLF